MNQSARRNTTTANTTRGATAIVAGWIPRRLARVISASLDGRLSSCPRRTWLSTGARYRETDRADATSSPGRAGLAQRRELGVVVAEDTAQDLLGVLPHLERHGEHRQLLTVD